MSTSHMICSPHYINMINMYFEDRILQKNTLIKFIQCSLLKSWHTNNIVSGISWVLLTVCILMYLKSQHRIGSIGFAFTYDGDN